MEWRDGMYSGEVGQEKQGPREERVGGGREGRGGGEGIDGLTCKMCILCLMG